MTRVCIQTVSKSFPGGAVALHPTDLTVEPGERLAFLGPSGSGKSTLLRLIAGLETPSAGTIQLNAVDVHHWPPARRGVGLLPQRATLYPQMTVAENIRISADTQSPLTIPAILELLRLGALSDRLPHQLSGGERQRAALAKLIAQNRPVWLLDEPFGSLDPMFREEFRYDLHLLHRQTQATIIFVTHDPIDAQALGQRIGIMGEGRLQQLGTAAELHDHPNNQFVAHCLGRVGFITGTLRVSTMNPQAIGSAGGGDHADMMFVSACGAVVVPVPQGITQNWSTDATSNLTLGIRPEDVHWQSPDSHNTPNLPGELVLKGWTAVFAEPVGSGWSLTLARGHSRIRGHWPPGSPPPVGTCATWRIPAGRCLWFDSTGQRIDE
jgi:ABC-type sugar transport system ATPase subunit